MEIHNPFSYVFTPSQIAASEQNILQGLLYVATTPKSENIQERA